MAITYLGQCVLYAICLNQVCVCVLSVGTEGTSCKSGQVLNGSECINITDCTLPVLSNRQCLQSCPIGYIYFTMSMNDDFDYPHYHYTLADINQNPCQSLNTFYILIGVFAVLNVAYILLVKMYLSTKKVSIEKLIICSMRRVRRGERERLLSTNTNEQTATYSNLI